MNEYKLRNELKVLININGFILSKFHSNSKDLFLVYKYFGLYKNLKSS